MEDYAYMCGECLLFYDTVDTFLRHVCHSEMDTDGCQEKKSTPSLPLQEEVQSVISTSIALQPSDVASSSMMPGSDDGDIFISKNTEDHERIIVIQTNDDGEGKINLSTQKITVQATNFVDGSEKDESLNPVKGRAKKRKKYQTMADEYRLNRIMRDKDFKFARSHFYCFKDTLGDWDERSTQLLIQFIAKYPKSHFLLPSKNEKRLCHWESIHREMVTAGYTFTILQLRMRWREVLQKFRWTVDYNDHHDIKKRCEYYSEMNELFGDWYKEATVALFNEMHRVKSENKNKKIVRIGYQGWEKITENLNSDGHKFALHMVEARWRNLVTLYQTVVNQNSLPNVEHRTMAYMEDMENLVDYVPKRRQNYEKRKGRSVKMERFPVSGSRILLQSYKDRISSFMDPAVNNSRLWDEIAQKLEDEGFTFTTYKLKEILNGMIKGFEKCKYHNSLPGAIKRNVPFYRELSEIYGVHSRWPHIQISRTQEIRTKRKFRLRLQVSQQLWSSEESQALLQVYPDALEAHVNQSLSHQASDLWFQVAKAYAATGCQKRDIHEIAIHIGLMRQGYAQGNMFPFVEEMRRVKEAEEAVCYSPDVSKFTGDVEIMYWSHNAVNLLLDLYLKHQATASTSQSCRNAIFTKIFSEMKRIGYRYNVDQIQDHFKTLLTQYSAQKSKFWSQPSTDRQTYNPVGAPYHEKLREVFELRKKLSLSWTKGVQPLSNQAQTVLFRVAHKKMKEMLPKNLSEKEQKKILSQIIEEIKTDIRTKRLIDPVPKSRQISLHLINALKSFEDNAETNRDVASMHKILLDYDITNMFCGFVEESELPNFKVGPKTMKKNSTNHWKRTKRSQRPMLTSQVKRRQEAAVNHEKSLAWTSEEEDADDPKEHKSVEEHITNLQEPVTRHYSDECVDEMQLSVDGINRVKSSTTVKSKLLRKTMEVRDAENALVNNGESQDTNGNETEENPDEQSVSKEVLEVQPRHAHVSRNFSEHSKFGLSENLSKELLLPSQSSCVKKKGRSKKTFPNRRQKRYRDSFDEASSNSSEDSETLGESFLGSQSDTDDDCGIGDKDDDDVDGVKVMPKTKVIQTRSGRRTRFTFFSKALGKDSDTEDENRKKNSFKPTRNDNKKMRMQEIPKPNLSICAVKRKRGRPRKNSDLKTLSNKMDSCKEPVPIIKRTLMENKDSKTGNVKKRSREPETVLSYKVLEGGRAVIDKSSSQNVGNIVSILDKKVINMNEFKRNFDDNDSKHNNDDDVSMSDHLQNHEQEGAEEDKKVLDILKQEHVEQANVMSQMLDVFKGLIGKMNDDDNGK